MEEGSDDDGTRRRKVLGVMTDSASDSDSDRVELGWLGYGAVMYASPQGSFALAAILGSGFQRHALLTLIASQKEKNGPMGCVPAAEFARSVSVEAIT